MLVRALAKVAETSGPLQNVTSADQQQKEVTTYRDILAAYEERKASGSTGTSTSIPVFFKPKTVAQNALTLGLRKEAKHRKEQAVSQASRFLSQESLHTVWLLLNEYAANREEREDAAQSGELATPPDVLLSYDGFSQVLARCREEWGPACAPLFKASRALMLRKDPLTGYLSGNQFLAYLDERSKEARYRQELADFDASGSGVLSVDQVEEWLRATAQDLPALAEMPTSFMPHYKRIAARKVLFFNARNGVVRLRDLARSAEMRQVDHLRQDDLPDNMLLSNWFSMQSTQRVHSIFTTLDEDMNGLLSRHEFAAISNGSMTTFFIQRIFEENAMRERMYMRRASYRDEIDLVAFADFVLAWDNRSSPAAIKYFFNIFDLQKQGRLSPADLYTFFKEIHYLWVHDLREYADLAIYDVVEELIDMVRPKDPPYVTAEDLATSGMSGTFFGCLADVRLFHEYNYRENNMHSDDAEGDQ